MRNFIITVDGKSYQVAVEEVGESAETAPATAAATPAPVKTPETKKTAVEGEKILSPFPGLIKNLLVADGTTVKKDQAVIVLEAMKMDNEITAPCDGKITFNVTKGSNVETNAVLAVIG